MDAMNSILKARQVLLVSTVWGAYNVGPMLETSLYIKILYKDVLFLRVFR